MLQRSVTVQEISTTLRNFDLTYPGDNDGLTVLKLFPDGRMLKVWIAESSLDQDPLTIKSVAWEGRE
jgi:hypothetical protein